MPHRGRRSCQAGFWFLSVWEHVLTPRDRDLNPVLGPVVIAPIFYSTIDGRLYQARYSPVADFQLLDVAGTPGYL
jgi:hypothetical protein